MIESPEQRIITLTQVRAFAITLNTLTMEFANLHPDCPIGEIVTCGAEINGAISILETLMRDITDYDRKQPSHTLHNVP